MSPDVTCFPLVLRLVNTTDVRVTTMVSVTCNANQSFTNGNQSHVSVCDELGRWQTKVPDCVAAYIYIYIYIYIYTFIYYKNSRW